MGRRLTHVPEQLERLAELFAQACADGELEDAAGWARAAFYLRDRSEEEA